MKRSDPRRQKGVVYGDVLKNFTVEQLAWIGAVAMAYNEAEGILHQMVGAVVDFPGDSHEVTSRINGVDGLIAIVRVGVERSEVLSQYITLFTKTLCGEGFGKLKTYRDAVIHARLVDRSSGVARVHASKGKRYDVLLSEQALQWLYNQLEVLKEELGELLTILQCERRISGKISIADEHKARLEAVISTSLTQCKKCQNFRISQATPPGFPEEPEFLSL